MMKKRTKREREALEAQMEKNKFYITTAIAYSSSKPHIGNTYEIILTDAIARYHRLLGYDVFFQTGTDEHGQKIETKAAEAGKTPIDYVNDVTDEIRKLWTVLGSSHDSFVRTTDPEHKDKVSDIFERLYKQGDIYKGEYVGLYCTPCESFFTESQLIEGKCPDCGREVKHYSEEAYFLKLSKYEDKLKQYLIDNPDFIEPESRKNEIVKNFLEPGLQDLCVSRTSFKWGVPVKFDDEHVVYVWIDALSNYITFMGYDPKNESSDFFKKMWPADLHVLGKDILRFHAIYWPIILMALNLDLPKKILAHPWVLMGEDKMSKSRGNIVYIDDLINEYGRDPVRYYFLSQVPFANDGTFTEELLVNTINSDLANVLGNLVKRTQSMIVKYQGGKLYPNIKYGELDSEYIKYIEECKKNSIDKIRKYRVADSLNDIMKIFERSNKYIDETTPWILFKEGNKERLEEVLYNLSEVIVNGAILLQAFLPDTSEKILDYFNVDEINTIEEKLTKLVNCEKLIEEKEPMFIRIEKDKK